MTSKILFVDTETTGFPRTQGFGKFYDYKDVKTYDTSRVVSYAFFLSDKEVENVSSECCNIVYPDFNIPNSDFHGITPEMALEEGVKWGDVTGVLESMVNESDFIVGHNIDFDVHVLCSELHRGGYKDLASKFFNMQRIDTMKLGTNITRLPGKFGNYKYPKLSELYFHFFREEMKGAHDAKQDILNTMKCYYCIQKLKK